MAWRTPTDAEIAALIGKRIDDVGIDVDESDADPERPAPDITNTTPDAQVAAYRKQMEDWPRRVIRRGDAVRPLPPHARSLADLTFEVGDLRLSVSDHMTSRRTAGLLILKDGEIALERYGTGRGPESPPW